MQYVFSTQFLLAYNYLTARIFYLLYMSILYVMLQQYDIYINPWSVIV